MEYKDYELSAEVLIKLLKDCACSEHSCMACPFEYEDEMCDSQLMLNAASKLENQAYAINGLRKNISKVNSDNDNYIRANSDLKDQVLRLKVEVTSLARKNTEETKLREHMITTQYASIDELNKKLAKTEAELGKYIKENANLMKQIEELEEEQEERCNSCCIPAIDGDPENFDLVEVVDGIIETCDSLVQHRRILPVTLFRYVEDVLHDRARERSRQREDGDDEE